MKSNISDFILNMKTSQNNLPQSRLKLESLLGQSRPQPSPIATLTSNRSASNLLTQQSNPKLLYIKTQEKDRNLSDRRFFKHSKIPIGKRDQQPLTDRIMVKDYSRKNSEANLQQLKTKEEPQRSPEQPLKGDRPTGMAPNGKSPYAPSLLITVRQRLKQLLSYHRMPCPNLQSLITYQQHFEYLLDLLRVTLESKQSTPRRLLNSKANEQLRQQMHILKETNRLLMNSEQLMRMKLEEMKEQFRHSRRMRFTEEDEEWGVPSGTWGKKAGGMTMRDNVREMVAKEMGIPHLGLRSNKSAPRIAMSSSASDIRYQGNQANGDIESLRMRIAEKNRLIKQIQISLRDKDMQIQKLKDRCSNLEKKCKEINEVKTLTTAVYEQQLLSTIKQLSESQCSKTLSQLSDLTSPHANLEVLNMRLSETIQEAQSPQQQNQSQIRAEGKTDLSKFRKKPQANLPPLIEVPRLNLSNGTQGQNDQIFPPIRSELLSSHYSQIHLISDSVPFPI